MNEEQSVDYRIGQLIGEKYRIVRRLGQGGMGAVYEARHEAIGRRFAIKFLLPEMALNANILARFEREAQAAGALESENIAAVTDFGKASDGAPYIVMEFLQGEDLSRLLGRTGPVPVPRAANIVIQACRGLDSAHAAGIVHRDLKPENLFVLRRGDGTDLIKVLDFGIAKLRRAGDSGSATRTGMALGTPFYMPPEQARGEKELDHRADVYALGVILYEILSGRKPHDGDGYNAILYKILTQAPARLETLRSNLPAGIADVVHRAMASDPAARYSDVRELMTALSPFVGATTPVPLDDAPPAGGFANVSVPTVATPTDVLAQAGTPLGTVAAVATNTDAPLPKPSSSKRLAVWLALGAVLVVGAGSAAVLGRHGTASSAEPLGSARSSPEVSALRQPPPAPPTSAPEPAPEPAAVSAAVSSGRPADTATTAKPSTSRPAGPSVGQTNAKISATKPARATPAQASATLAPKSQRDLYAP